MPEGGTPPPGTPGLGLAFIDFESIADVLPPSFLPPEAVSGVFDAFGEGHPLIGDDGTVNPDLEEALFEHPPVPEGFDGFDFVGDKPQFDDLFSTYDAANVGATVQGQVNATFTHETDDGMLVKSSGTTVVEAITGQATPMILMEEGVYQTQWVVDIHQVTTSQVTIENPDDPDNPQVFDTTHEVFSQMTWTMLVKEVDTDGDGVVDELQTTGANAVEVLEENLEGGPEGDAPPLPTPPSLLPPLQFQGVMKAADTEPATEETELTDDSASADESATLEEASANETAVAGETATPDEAAAESP